MSDRGYRRPRPLSPLREHLRDTFWSAPTLGFVCVFVLGFVASELDDTLVALLLREGAYDQLADLIAFSQDTRTVVTTIGSGVMTFIGVVFSISLVAVQMAGGRLTPRVVRIFVRSRISKLTLTVFLATFLVSLLVLSSYEGETDPRRMVSVPLVQSLLILLLVGTSLLLFVVHMNAMLRLMQVGPVVDRIARGSPRVVGRMPPGSRGEEHPGPETARVLYEGRAGVLRDVNTARPVRAARRQGVVLRLVPRIGDFVVPGTPVLAVHGGAAPPRRRSRTAVSVSPERTLHQDLAMAGFDDLLLILPESRRAALGAPGRGTGGRRPGGAPLCSSSRQLCPVDNDVQGGAGARDDEGLLVEGVDFLGASVGRGSADEPVLRSRGSARPQRVDELP